MEERVLIEGVANSIKSKFFVENGHGILTNKRFIYCKHSLAKIFAMGLLINLTKGDYEYDIPIENIAKYEIINKGIRGNILCIYSRDGDIHKYGILKALDWKIAFDNVLSESAQTSENPPAAAEAEIRKKFCSNCGSKLDETDKFCPSCGTKI